MTHSKPKFAWRAALTVLVWGELLIAAQVADLAEASPAGRGRCSSPGRAELNQRFARDMRAKQLKDVLGLYSADAVFVNPDGSSVRDPVGLRKLYLTVFATYDSDLRLQTVAVTRSAGRRIECVEDGVYEENLRTRTTGVVQHLRGRYRFTSRPGAGGWRYSRMQWLSE